MKPYIICHMIASVDGKIDAGAFATIANAGDYEATARKLRGARCPAHLPQRTDG